MKDSKMLHANDRELWTAIITLLILPMPLALVLLLFPKAKDRILRIRTPKSKKLHE